MTTPILCHEIKWTQERQDSNLWLEATYHHNGLDVRCHKLIPADNFSVSLEAYNKASMTNHIREKIARLDRYANSKEAP